MSGRQLPSLLRRFRLPPQATKSELRQAYLKEAKALHPDVAGKSSEDQFRQLKDEYEDAMKLLLKEAEEKPQRAARRDSQDRGHGPSAHGFPSGYDWSRSAGAAQWEAHYQFHQQFHHQQASSSRSSRPPEPAFVMQTPAQRMRNLLLAAVGTSAAAVLLSRWTMAPAPQPAMSRRPQAAGPGEMPATQAHVAEPTAFAGAPLAAAATASDNGVARTRSANSGAEAGPAEVAAPGSSSSPAPSAYYRSRHTKSTVRVRGSDAFDVDPNDPLKSSSAARTEEARESSKFEARKSAKEQKAEAEARDSSKFEARESAKEQKAEAEARDSSKFESRDSAKEQKAEA